ncbi:hypothetical protein RJT34_16675 [Clitoria ternatea]|uniref:Uncharacterized protein n=1 Tax=Clitoria ternatea TaxID=43366 RepID=A0AAN9J7L3_CLITE
MDEMGDNVMVQWKNISLVFQHCLAAWLCLLIEVRFRSGVGILLVNVLTPIDKEEGILMMKPAWARPILALLSTPLHASGVRCSLL